MRKLIELKCPECGAQLQMKEQPNTNTYYCNYCGAKVVLDNDNEHIYKYVDEADLKRAETEQLVKLKKMELAEKRREERKKQLPFKILGSIILLVLFATVTSMATKSGETGHWGYSVGLLLLAAIIFIWANPFTGFDDDDDDDE